jgi:hypothetical protein
LLLIEPPADSSRNKFNPAPRAVQPLKIGENLEESDRHAPCKADVRRGGNMMSLTRHFTSAAAVLFLFGCGVEEFGNDVCVQAMQRLSDCGQETTAPANLACDADSQHRAQRILKMDCSQITGTRTKMDCKLINLNGDCGGPCFRSTKKAWEDGSFSWGGFWESMTSICTCQPKSREELGPQMHRQCCEWNKDYRSRVQGWGGDGSCEKNEPGHSWGEPHEPWGGGEPNPWEPNPWEPNEPNNGWKEPNEPSSWWEEPGHGGGGGSCNCSWQNNGQHGTCMAPRLQNGLCQCPYNSPYGGGTHNIFGTCQ